MAYTKTNWSLETLTPENLNKMQTQYAEAVAEALGIRTDNSEIRLEVVTDFPAHKVGRMIYHTGLKTCFFSTGSKWYIEPVKQDFGNSNLGDFTSTGNVTFNNTVGDTVVRNYKNFTLSSGHTLTTQNPCRLLAIRAWGDININGTIDLSKKGGYGDRYVTINGFSYDLIGGDGGNGGDGYNNAGSGGDVNLNQNCAGGRKGGGGGGATAGGKGGAKNAASSNGGGSTVFSMATTYDTSSVTVNGQAGGVSQGGSGQAQAIGDIGNTFSRATSLGGARNVGLGASGGGGLALVYGANKNIQTVEGAAGEIGGGVIILMALGAITVNGQILANGGAGGDGAYGRSDFLGTINNQDASGGGAGGSGGGCIYLIHRQGYNNAGLVQANGGAGGASLGSLAGANGSPGNNGNIDVIQLI